MKTFADDLPRKRKTLAGNWRIDSDSPLLANGAQPLMDGRAIRRGIVDQTQPRELFEQRRCATDMQGIAVAEKHTIEPVHSGGVEIRAQHPLVIAFVSAIEQPVTAAGAQVDSRARADIQHGHMSPILRRPVWMCDVVMAAGKLRKEVHAPDNNPRETPVGVIENN